MPAWIGEWGWWLWSKFWAWLTRIPGDVVIGIIGGLVGGYIGSVYADYQATENFRMPLNNVGIGYPALLFDEAKREDRKLSVAFNPQEFGGEQLRVCEYYSDRQRSFRLIMERYLEKYSACFIPVWQGENQLEIRPNIHSGQLEVRADASGRKTFWCKCSATQMSPR